MDCLYLTDGVGMKGRFPASFVLFVLFLNKAYLTHLFPVFLKSLYQEPGKLSVLVFGFSDSA